MLWEDPSTEWEGWVDLDSVAAKKPELVFSLGWPAREDDTHLYIVMDWSDGKGNVMGKIPKHSIIARKKVKLRNFPPKAKEDKGEIEKEQK